jgi:exopolysaccharide production protein ExoY
MLIQMPRGSTEQSDPQNAQECSSFEAALRRDLASAPLVSYDSTIGGWSKRAVDLTLTLLSSPIWIPLLVVLIAWAKLRHPAPVLQRHERIGYGGRAFTCHTLRLVSPSAVIERLHAAGADAEAQAVNWRAMAVQAEGRLTKWWRALERLPLLFSVLQGDMAIVGPGPLSREELASLRLAKRYYLSARPGVVGVGGVADAHDASASQYKIYAMAWSHATDALILWDAAHSLFDRGELWRPKRRVLNTRRGGAVRLRSSAAE